MPECLKCQQYFPYRISIDNKVRSLTKRKFCLDCSPFGTHNTTDLSVERLTDTKICPRCNKEQSLSHYYPRKSRNRGGDLSSYCKSCVKLIDVEARRNKKKFAVSYKGGKCVLCGYDRCLAALDFHHTDPNEKDMGIGKLSNVSLDRLIRELDKCILVCSNCHREIHSNPNP